MHVFALFWLIVLTAVFFRLWHLNATPPGLFPDEAMNGNNAHEALRTAPPASGFKMFYPENNGREGLFINLQALSVRVLGHTSFALRFVAALFGIGTVIALYFFVREYTENKRTALFASFLVATSFWHVLISRLGFRANMAPFALTAGLACLYYAYNRRHDKPHASALLASVLGGIFFGIGFHSYIAYRIAPLILIPPLLLFIQSARRDKMGCVLCIPALFLFFTFVAAVPLGYYFLVHPQDFFGRTAQISIFQDPNPLFALVKNTAKTLQMFYFAGDFNQRHNLSGSPELWWPVAIFFTIGIVESVRKRYWVLFLWFAIMLLPVVISSEGVPHALRAIVVIPPVFAFAGIGAAHVWRWFELHRPFFRIVGKIAMIVLCAAIVYQTGFAYFITWAKSENTSRAFGGDLYAIGLFLNRAPLDVPKYVITDEVESIDRTGRPMALQPILFVTETYLPEPDGYKNIFYKTLKDAPQITCDPQCIIIPLGNREKVKETMIKNIPSLVEDMSAGFLVLQQ